MDPPAGAEPSHPLRLVLGLGLERRARVAYLGVVALGAACVLAALAMSLPAPLDVLFVEAPVPLGVFAWPAALGFAVLFFLLEKQGFVFRWGGETTKVSLDEIALFLGLVILPPGHVVIAVAGSCVANQALHRRDPMKATFNVAQYAVAAAVAAGATLALRMAGVPRPWPAVAGPVVFAVATAWLVSLLFSRMQGERLMPVFRSRFGALAFVGAALGTGMGLIAYALYRFEPLAVLAVLPVLLFLRRFGRLSEWADEELKTHKLLAAVSAEVAGRGDLDAVAGKVLTACHELLDCGEAQLTLTTPEPPRSWRRLFAATPLGHGGITTPVLDAHGTPMGQLTAFPKHGQRGYGEREHHLLRTVAANAAAAAANARALKAAEDANRELMASEGRYHHLFETAHVQVLVLDEEGRVLDVNPAARAVLGDALRGREPPSVDELIAPTGEGAPPLSVRLRSLGEVRGLEATMRGPDGEPLCVLVDAKVLEVPGQARTFVAFARDITSLKALEGELREVLAEQKETIRRLENMNRELEEFTLWTTHDMREPLRSIGTIAEILHEDVGKVSPDEAQEMARRIHQGAERLKERVKALHAFSRIVQQDDAFSDVDLQAVVEEVVSTMEAAARERGATIVLPARSFPVVRAQPQRLHQVVANLVENALKYGHAEGAQPRVELGFEETPEGWRVFVQDDGPGVPPQYHERIFLLFQRGPDQGEGGSGAGLAIVKRIVEQHGGRVWVESLPGHGACFSFTLPRGVQPSAGGRAAALVRR